jgi:hypothetical protein
VRVCSGSEMVAHLSPTPYSDSIEYVLSEKAGSELKAHFVSWRRHTCVMEEAHLCHGLMCQAVST